MTGPIEPPSAQDPAAPGSQRPPSDYGYRPQVQPGYGYQAQTHLDYGYQPSGSPNGHQPQGPTQPSYGYQPALPPQPQTQSGTWAAQSAYAPAPAPGGSAPRPRGGAAWTGLTLALIATAGVGICSWFALTTIEFDSSPFDTAKWWFAALIVSCALPLVALILSIVAAVKKAHRGVAIAGLAIAVLGPAITGAIGASEGANSLASRFESVAEDASGWLTDALRGSDLPDWAEKLIEGTEFYNELDP